MQPLSREPSPTPLLDDTVWLDEALPVGESGGTEEEEGVTPEWDGGNGVRMDAKDGNGTKERTTPVFFPWPCCDCCG